MCNNLLVFSRDSFVKPILGLVKPILGHIRVKSNQIRLVGTTKVELKLNIQIRFPNFVTKPALEYVKYLIIKIYITFYKNQTNNFFRQILNIYKYKVVISVFLFVSLYVRS